MSLNLLIFPPADGRGRGRGARGSGPQRGGRRPFDRHSQTGKTSVPLNQFLISPFINPPSDSDKKLHQSWGGDDGNAELKTEQAATNDAAAEGAGTNDWSVDSAPAEAWGSPAATPTADAWGTPETAPGADAWSAPVADTTAPPEADKPEGRPRREREPEEEDNTLTLEQYLAQQKEKESVIPKLEATRKANEGADANIWKDVVPLQKEDEDAYFVGKVGVLIIPPCSPSLWSSCVCRSRQRQKLVPRRKKRSFWKSRHGSNVLIVVVVVVAEVIGGVTEDGTGVVVVAVAVQEVAARMLTALSMLMMQQPSLPCLEFHKKGYEL